ncbi:MAG: hypothetical protein U0610_26435 [bacterium]
MKARLLSSHRRRAAAATAMLVAVSLGHASCSSSSGKVGTRAPFARAYAISDRNQLIGGKVAIANVGDFILENDQVRLAVLGALESYGPNLYGGSLVDAELQRPDGSSTAGRGQDELVEVFPIIDLKVAKPDGTLDGPGNPVSSSVRVCEDGGSGQGARARIRMAADLYPLIALVGVIPNLLGPSGARIVQDYILEPGKRYATLHTEVRFFEGGEGAGQPIECGDDPNAKRVFKPQYPQQPLNVISPVLFGQAYGDIAIFGGTTQLFSPTFGFDSFSELLAKSPSPTSDVVYDEIVPFKNTFESPLNGYFLVGRANHISYGMTAPDKGVFTIPLLAGTIAPQFVATSREMVDATTGAKPSPLEQVGSQRGDVATFDRYFIVGDGDVASVLDVVNQIQGVATGAIHGHAFEEATGRPVTRASILVFRHPRDGAGNLRDLATLDVKDLGVPIDQIYTDVRFDDTSVDGSFSATLEPGDYVLLGLSDGRGRGPLQPVAVRAGESRETTVVIPRDGRVRVEVVDAARGGASLPTKLTITELDGHGVPWPRFGEGSLPIARIPRANAIYEPQTADASRSDLEFVAAFKYTEDGRNTFSLAPGRYRVYASRGYEYTIDTKDVVIEPGLEKTVQLAIAQVVDSTGWLSGDFHVHSESSHDSGVSKDDRVVGYAAEGVEILASTDHDYMTNYKPYIENHQLRPWLTTIVGDELTTFENGHYNAMPLAFDGRQTSNGAPRWVGLTPPQIFDTLRARGLFGPDQTVTILNHPRDSIFGLYSQFGFDQGTGVLCPGLFTLGNDVIRTGNGLGGVNAENFNADFMSIEVLNGKRFELIRTPTLEEVPLKAEGQTRPGTPPSIYQVLARTLDEQRRLLDPANGLATSDQSRYQGGVDDLFTTINLGRGRPTGLANSDSHKIIDTASVRTWFKVGTDQPDAAEDLDVVAAVARGQTVMGFGPFVTLTADGAEVGKTVANTSGQVDVAVEVQGPDWFQIDRVEIYGNGELAAEIPVARPNASTVKYRGHTTISVRDLAINDHQAKDTYFVAVALGDDDLFPVDFPNSFPTQNTSDIIVGALAGVIPGIGGLLGEGENIVPLTFNVLPYGVTSPVYVDVDGDGRFTPAGRPPADGRSKYRGCTDLTEDCVCQDLALPASATQDFTDTRDYVQWLLGLEQGHGRLKAVPPAAFEFAGR